MLNNYIHNPPEVEDFDIRPDLFFRLCGSARAQETCNVLLLSDHSGKEFQSLAMVLRQTRRDILQHVAPIPREAGPASFIRVGLDFAATRTHYIVIRGCSQVQLPVAAVPR